MSSLTTEPVASTEPRRGGRKIMWMYVVPIVALHTLALVAAWPWLFSWTGLIVCILGVHVFGQGINLCYHRLLTHQSFVVPKWLEHFFVVIALCCMQDGPAKWVATHRYHHVYSDEEPDPHTPLVTFLWAHMGWLFVEADKAKTTNMFQKYARDIIADPFYKRLQKNPWLPLIFYVLHALLFVTVGAAIGYFTSGGSATETTRMALSLLVWGVIVRTVIVWHITWAVNSLTHLFGYQNYNTGENSRNNWLVAILTVGEGWHNNHHHDPTAASVQHKWWEIDITYYEIKLLELPGLADPAP
jgi:stearoyl-CoA desaturase (delta-9 desaturase)